MKNVVVIIGSASTKSANQQLMRFFAHLAQEDFNCSIFNDLKILPHFDPEQSVENTPAVIIDFRSKIENADGVLICTPEYIFSIPSGLKNALEWCVSTTIFSNKPTGLITASASGIKGQEELQLILQTLMAKFNHETTMIISGIKGKINEQGKLLDDQTLKDLIRFKNSFKALLFNQD